jgi:ubiquinone/menaquinone biosynthesis C-methylase UbiE
VITAESHYVALAAAYVRGVVGDRTLDDDAALARGEAQGLRLHRFKRTAGLQRVRAVLGALRSLGAASLVDLGSGRGAFVWPLLDAMPELALVATDVLPHRAQLYEHVRRGGLDRVAGVRADITALPFADAAVDCVTALEVLEHLPDQLPALAAREALRVARTAVVASVPAHADNNPEHVQLFDRASITALFTDAGARRVSVDFVLDHIIVVAMT